MLQDEGEATVSSIQKVNIQVFQLLEDHDTIVLEERHMLNSLWTALTYQPISLPTYIQLNQST